MSQTKNNITTLAGIHGLYFLVTGLWPIFHMRSFLLVTGPKTDLWLVETVGMLAFVIGLGLLAGFRRKIISFPLALIAVGSATGFLLIDVIFVWKNVISPIYLLDALIEVIFIILWSVFIIKKDLYKTLLH